jgi:hypothetical protein
MAVGEGMKDFLRYTAVWIIGTILSWAALPLVLLVLLALGELGPVVRDWWEMAREGKE